MIPLLAIIIFMMNFFSSLQAWEGGAEGDGWVVLQLQVGNGTKGMRIGFPSGKLAAKRTERAGDEIPSGQRPPPINLS